MGKKRRHEEKDISKSKPWNDLRQKAEDVLRMQPQDLQKLPVEDIQYLIHELGVHQIELEMQNEELNNANEELHNAQMEIEESRIKYVDLYDFAPVGYFTIDKDGLIVEVNLAGADQLGQKRGLLINQPFNLSVAADDRDIFYLHYRKIYQTRTRQICELKLKKKDGTESYAQLESIPVKDELGNISRCRIIVSDISKRKQAEEELKKYRDHLEQMVKERTGELTVALENLRESERKYSTLVEKAGDGVGIVQEGVFRFVNRAAVKISGYAAEELTDKPFLAIVPPQLRGLLSQSYRSYLAGEEVPALYETKLQCKDGTVKDIEASLSVIQYNGKPAVIAIARDVSARKKAEEATKRAYKELDQIFNATADGMCVIDKEFKIRRINRSFQMLLGMSREEVIGKNCYDLLHDSLCKIPTCPITRILSGEERIEYDTEIKRRDGSTIPCILTATPFRSNGELIGIVENFKDITDRKKMEEERQKVEKLSSIGTLAGGIAHDFNNLLATILGNLSLTELYIKSGDEVNSLKVDKLLSEMKKGCHRATSLTQQLLTFSKGGAPIKKPASIKELLEDTAIFALRGSSVRCEFHIPDNLSPVEIDEGQISQVVNNLMINAQQAMPRGGTIKVSAENATVGINDGLPLRANYGLPLKDGKYVKMSIKDQGVGIPEEYLRNIFDPYFTTKQEGSGLGLAICYSIIIQHGGYITVESEVGVGTSFYIYLPVSEKEIFKVEGVVEKKLCFGEGKVLLMDDDVNIRDTVGQILVYLGYEVEFARDGAEAIELYEKGKEAGQTFDAVVLDLTIPGGMGGKEVIRKLLEIDPQVKAIVSSGYANYSVMSEYKEYGFNGVVAKPFEIKELSEVLCRVIRGRAEYGGSRSSREEPPDVPQDDRKAGLRNGNSRSK